MRRLIPTVYSSRHLLRFVASRVVLQNVPFAKSSAKIGAEVSREELAKAFKLPAEILHEARRPAEILFVQMDIARARFAPLIASLSAEEDLTRIAAQVKAAKSPQTGTAQADAKAPALSPVTGAKERFKTTAWKSLRELMAFYEEVLFPAREKWLEYKLHELNSFHAKDDIKRGLSAFKQDHIDKQKTELARLQKLMQECQVFIKKIGESCFDVHIFNDIANILRICGETNPYAHRMALQVLEDMSFLGIPFDETTVKLLHAATFSDGPFDDSALMFTLLEYPERGEVSISKDAVEKIADDALRVISKRHQTPLDDGRLLRQTDTHPCLQRSSE